MTRPEPDATAFAAQCREAGIDPVLAPLFDIALRADTVDCSNVRGVAFTSANGVRAFAALSERRDLPAFVVGDASARAAADAGFVSVTSASGDVTSLAEKIAAAGNEPTGDILHVAGTHLAGDLAALLSSHGIAARRTVIYEAKAATSVPGAMADFLNDPADGWVSLFSPRTAEIFFRLTEKAGLVGHLPSKRAACLSNAVAAIVDGRGFRAVSVSAVRNGESIIELMRGAHPA